jgi:hypothetical protein
MRPGKTVEQQRQLCRRHVHHATPDRRPCKTAAFEPFCRQNYAGAVPSEKLDPVTPLRAEYHDVAAVRVDLQSLRGKRGQTRNPFAKVHRLCGDPHAHSCAWCDQRRPLIAASTIASVAASASEATRIVASASAISIAPDAGDNGVTFAASAGSMKFTGTKPGADTSFLALARQRQVERRSRATPCRAATSETLAPGRKLSSTIAAF